MKPPLRVMITADTVGGVWTYARDLARGLSDSGATPILALVGPNAPGGPAREFAGIETVDTGLPLDWLAETPDEILSAGRALARLAAESRVDLLHLNSPAFAAGASFAMPVVGACHSCLRTWWDAVRGGDPPESFRWRTDLLAQGYAACDALLAPSHAFARATAAAYGLPEAPIVVHNGREARGRASPVAGEEPAPFILTAGRLWDDGKNLALLDRVAGRLPAPVLAAGATSGPNGAAIGLDHVRPLGFVPAADLDALYARRPVFASLALYEPFGLAVLEAAQHGCALVLSDIPAFRELWDGAALFVPFDERDAARALGDLLGDTDRRTALGEAAWGRSRRYSADRAADGTLALYGHVLAAARPVLAKAG